MHTKTKGPFKTRAQEQATPLTVSSLLTSVCPFITLQPMKPSRGLRPMSMLSLWALSRTHFLISR